MFMPHSRSLFGLMVTAVVPVISISLIPPRSTPSPPEHAAQVVKQPDGIAPLELMEGSRDAQSLLPAPGSMEEAKTLDPAKLVGQQVEELVAPAALAAPEAASAAAVPSAAAALGAALIPSAVAPATAAVPDPALSTQVMRQSQSHSESQSHELSAEDQIIRTQVLQDLWSGHDLRDGSFGFAKLARRLPWKHEDTPVERAVHVFGLPNAGVDLLNAILYLNFGYRLNYYVDKPTATNDKLGFYRISNLKELWRVNQTTVKQLDDSEVYAIMMVRNPFSWLQAMRTTPYEWDNCVDGDDWLNQDCSIEEGGNISSYPSIEGVWNQWVEGYHNATNFGLHRRLVITYETLVKDPKYALERIAEFLNITKPIYHVVPDVGENTPNRDAVASKIKKKTYLKEFNEVEKHQVCNHIDWDLQQTYRYSDDCTFIDEDNTTNSTPDLPVI